MTIVEYENSSAAWFIPTFAITDSGSRLFLPKSKLYSALPENKITKFELPHDRWFCYANGQIVRFKKSDESAFRFKMAQELADMAKTKPPENAIKFYENAAELILITLPDLMKFLRENTKSGETMTDTFLRLRSHIPK